jgi:nucleotide-binding universal stress UspA family protein
VNADLIIIGSRGLTDWQGLLLGSVAHKVIHHATCPVLVVR